MDSSQHPWKAIPDTFYIRGPAWNIFIIFMDFFFKTY